MEIGGGEHNSPIGCCVRIVHYCTWTVLAGTLSAAGRDGKASLNFCKLLHMAPNSAVGGFSVPLN
jgi:hypothetical protein